MEKDINNNERESMHSEEIIAAAPTGCAEATNGRSTPFLFIKSGSLVGIALVLLAGAMLLSCKAKPFISR